MKFDDYKEKKQHGTSDLPLQYYYVDKGYPQYVMPLHWHREGEILRVLSGRLHIFLNNEAYELCAGDMIFIPPGTLHRGDPEACVYDCAVFDLRIASGYNMSRASELIQPLIAADCLVNPMCPSIREIGARILNLAADNEPYIELAASSAVAEMVYLLYSTGAVSREASEDKRVSHRRALMTLLMDKIERDFASKITLTDLAEIANMNEKYLCRFFKEYTGQTPIDYINRLRIERSCFDMTVNKMSVTDAAYECGFNELSYFSKMFKKYKGVTPGQYKQQFALR